jgi:dGTPase
VDAAGLAHDLGHPPFGHIAEKTLDALVSGSDRTQLDREGYGEALPAVSDPDGFEGNAQSFRILTKLAAHHPRNYPGLNLTRATLDSVLKYPWRRELGAGPETKAYRKYGAYISEEEDLDFARKYHGDRTQSLEAAIMDFADGLAYSVHDLEDFIRAGLVPLARLVTPREWQRFIEDWRSDTRDESIREALQEAEVIDVLSDLAVSLDLGEEYSGTRLQRARLRSRTSSLIREFLPEVRIAPSGAAKPLVVNRLHEIQMKFLQRLIWYYVIENPRLATQQAGQTRVVEMLFGAFFVASEVRKNGQPKNRHLLPPSVEKDLDHALKLEGDAQVRARLRLAADAVCSFTDSEAIAMSNRLRGTSPGAVTDLVSR